MVFCLLYLSIQILAALSKWLGHSLPWQEAEFNLLANFKSCGIHITRLLATIAVMSVAMREQERCIFCLTHLDSMSDPRKLPCSHVFCHDCLEANPHKDGIECVACRYVYPPLSLWYTMQSAQERTHKVFDVYDFELAYPARLYPTSVRSEALLA